MKTLTLSAAAAALLGACVSVAPPDNTFAYRPGTGVIANVREARVAVPSGALAGSAAAGGRYGTPIERAARPRWIEGRQLTLRMDDGTTQAVTQDSAAFRVGDAVQLTNDGRVVKLAASPSNAPSGSSAPSAALPRPGDGTVVSAAAAAASAASGGTAKSSTGEQVTVRMDDGTTQVVTLLGGTARPGERVRITSDGRLERL